VKNMSMLELPDDIVAHVMSFAENASAVCSQQLVCKHFSQAGRSTTLWRSLYHRQWQTPRLEPHDWFHTYADAYAANYNLRAGKSSIKKIPAHTGGVCCLALVENETTDFISCGKDGVVKV
jgi:hypothetical protein